MKKIEFWFEQEMSHFNDVWNKYLSNLSDFVKYHCKNINSECSRIKRSDFSKWFGLLLCSTTKQGKKYNLSIIIKLFNTTDVLQSDDH